MIGAIKCFNTFYTASSNKSLLHHKIIAQYLEAFFVVIIKSSISCKRLVKLLIRSVGQTDDHQLIGVI